MAAKYFGKIHQAFISLLTFAGFFREYWRREYGVFLPLITSVVSYSINLRVKMPFSSPVIL